jgi:heme/copper-type cytochrome/quinol oxidase subunit 2
MGLNMTKRQWIILGSLLLFVIVVIVFGVSQKKKPPEEQTIKQGETPTDVSATGTKRVEFVAEVPKNATITIPVAAVPSANGGNTIFGLYRISASKNGFSPNLLTVKNGDVVKIEFTSVDGDYDLSIPQNGVSIFSRKGETKKISFIVDTVGTFLFECRDSCPDGNKISGKFIVLPK